MITPKQIRERKLSVVENGGYNRGEVNKLLLEIIESYDSVYNENKELYRKMEVLANRIEEYRGDEDSIKTALITAQKMSTKLVSEANEKAKKTVSDSNATAQKTVLDARTKADEIIADAKGYANSIKGEKEAEAEKIVAEAQKTANNAIERAKTLAKELYDDAAAERTFNEEAAAKLKNEYKTFKDNLITLYEEQLDELRNINEKKFSQNNDGKSYDELKDEFKNLISDMEELAGDSVQLDESVPYNDTDLDMDSDTAYDTNNDPVPELEELGKVIDLHEEADPESETEEATDEPNYVIEETLAPQESESNDDEDDEEDNGSDDDDAFDSIDDLLEEIDSMNPIDFGMGTVKKNDDVNDALDSFSSDDYTPVSGSQPYIPIIEDDEGDELEDLEGSMAFEKFFNVNRHDPHNTNETISLISPDEDDNEDDDEDDEDEYEDYGESDENHRGFFRKRK